MYMGEISMQAVFAHGHTSTKNDPSMEIQQLEQKKEKLTEQSRSTSDSAEQENIAGQIDRINKRIQSLTARDGKEVSAPADENSKIRAARIDEYIGSDLLSKTDSIGIYRLVKDGDRNSKISYSAPEKESVSSSEKSGGQGTVNTDRVDSEIRNLKKEKQQLEQAIRSAAGDDVTREKLEKRLEQIEAELNRKDNETYRKQHAEYSESNG